MATRSQSGLNTWVLERLAERGVPESRLLEHFEEWSPCYFGFHDYAEALEGLTVPQLKRLAETLDVSPLSLLRKDYEQFRGLPLHEMIRARREHLNMTRQELSEASGWEASVIEALEAGSDDVLVVALRTVAHALELPLEYLVEQL